MDRQETPLHKYLDKHVYNRMRTVIIFAVVFAVITVYFVVALGLEIPLAVLSFLIGLMVGIIVSRRHKLSWDSETSQIVSDMDLIGFLIFIFYIIFLISRSYFLGQWVHGSAYFSVIFAITAGVMVGRLVGTRYTLKKIKENLKGVNHLITNR